MADQPKQYGMTVTDMIKLLNEDPRNVTSNRTETNLKLKFPLYNLFIEFPTIPSDSIYSKLTFPAYISSPITDTFTPTYTDAGTVFGRMDPIPIYSKTTRAIKVAFNIPANDLLDAREIRKKLDILAKNTYPTFKLSNDSQKRLTISRPPLIRIKFGNIICNPLNQGSGLLGYLAGGIGISHDLASGVFVTELGQEIYAKKYSIDLSMNVLHEFTPGFVDRSANSAPYNEGSMIWPGVKTPSPQSAGTVTNSTKKDAEDTSTFVITGR